MFFYLLSEGTGPRWNKISSCWFWQPIYSNKGSSATAWKIEGKATQRGWETAISYSSWIAEEMVQDLIYWLVVVYHMQSAVLTFTYLHILLIYSMICNIQSVILNEYIKLFKGRLGCNTSGLVLWLMTRPVGIFKFILSHQKGHHTWQTSKLCALLTRNCTCMY